MKDSIRTPMGRSLSWLAIWGSLVCLAGCAGLTGPSQSPAGMFSPSATSAPSQAVPSRVASPGLMPNGAAPNGVSQANSITTSSAPGYAGNPSAPSNTIAQTGATAPYVARQYPNNPPAPSYNFASPAGPPLPPGSDFTPPAISNTGLPDPYAPVAPYANYQPGPRSSRSRLGD